MDIFTIQQDIPVRCVSASSFPEGIPAAFDRLMTQVSTPHERTIYGISFPDKTGRIIYRAAVSLLPDDQAEDWQGETFLIRKGKYISDYIDGFSKDPQRIGTVFASLLNTPGIDPAGYCLEIYTGADAVRCLVPLLDEAR